MKNSFQISDIEKIIEGDIQNPFLSLGPHKTKTSKGEYVTIRACIPNAQGVNIVSQKYTPALYPMHRVEKTDIFETVTDQKEFFPYKIEVESKGGGKDIAYDPYSFPSTISEEEQLLFKEGKGYSAYETLGTHRKSINGIEGVRFALWAPDAGRVSVVGDFNYWEGRRHMMRLLGESGIWEIFIPSLKDGDKYKFELRTKGREIYIKSDPYARYAELRPKTASILSNTDDWEWGDKKWLDKRRNTPPKKHLSIYEAGLDPWSINKDNGGLLNYREIAHLLAKYLKKMGYTHIELTPIQENHLDHPYGYRATNYFAPTGRFGTPEDFLYLIDHLHRHNIGVIMNWVPAGGFPPDGDGLSNFDGTCLYEYSASIKGSPLTFNFGRREVINFLISNTLFWLRKYHIDGISILSANYRDKDGGSKNLAEEDFLKEFNMAIQTEFPDIITLTKKSTSWPE